MQAMPLLVRFTSRQFSGSADAARWTQVIIITFLGNHEFDAGNEGLLKLLWTVKNPCAFSYCDSW